MNAFMAGNFNIWFDKHLNQCIDLKDGGLLLTQAKLQTGLGNHTNVVFQIGKL